MVVVLNLKRGLVAKKTGIIVENNDRIALIQVKNHRYCNKIYFSELVPRYRYAKD